MGLDYSYEIFCPRNKLWEVIDTVMELAKPRADYSTTITFGDQQKGVPQWLSYERDTFSLDDPQRDDRFCLSIPFRVDDAIGKYLKDERETWLRQNPESQSWEPEFDSRGRIFIGCIYFDIVTDLDAIGRTGYDAGLVGFEFTAATTSMSCLFYASQSIRQTFLELAKKHDAVYCLFTNGATKEPKPMVLWMDGKECAVEIDEDWQPMSQVRQLVNSSSPA
jgi:hypothetical protein